MKHNFLLSCTHGEIINLFTLFNILQMFEPINNFEHIRTFFADMARRNSSNSSALNGKWNFYENSRRPLTQAKHPNERRQKPLPTNADFSSVANSIIFSFVISCRNLWVILLGVLRLKHLYKNISSKQNLTFVKIP